MMRKKWKYFLISAALLTIIFVSIERYDNYIGLYDVCAAQLERT